MGTTSGEPTMVEYFNDLELAGRRNELGPRFIEQYPSHLIAAGGVR